MKIKARPSLQTASLFHSSTSAHILTNERASSIEMQRKFQLSAIAHTHYRSVNDSEAEAALIMTSEQTKVTLGDFWSRSLDASSEARQDLS